MKKIKVLLDFIKLSVALKIECYRNVIKKMRENVAIFVTPDISLDQAEDFVDVLETKNIAATDGGHAATVAMYSAEEAADNAFRTLAAYVDRIADGSENTILLSGFYASKQPVTFNKPVLSATNGSNSGSVKLVAKAVPGAASYIWQYAKNAIPEDESGWIQGGFTTRADTEVSGLDVAAKYYFRMAAITASGTTDFCNPILKVVE
jgi:hypothetical protein